MKPVNIELLSNATRNIVVMGVSGCGKSTVASQLTIALKNVIAPRISDWQFYDADDFHPPANVEKMRRAEPLNDEDREPWLHNLNRAIKERDTVNKGTVLACSALKEKYRTRLKQGLPNMVFIHLQGSFDLIAQRMANRSNHYMPTALLKSQFETLEVPNDAVTFNIETPINEIIHALIQQFTRT
jgi:carbohydrate kinase (thermoresistant glucokinase family)